MKIDGYEITYNKQLRHEEYFAIAGKKRIQMPEAFKDMYTDDYLEIELVHSERPEVHGIETDDYYIPKRTAL